MTKVLVIDDDSAGGPLNGRKPGTDGNPQPITIGQDQTAFACFLRWSPGNFPNHPTAPKNPVWLARMSRVPRETRLGPEASRVLDGRDQTGP
jgi:hypothetical protein